MASDAWLPNLVGEVSMWNLAGDLNRPAVFDGRLLEPSIEGPDNLPTKVEWNVTELVPLAEARAIDPEGVERAIADFARCVESARVLFEDPAFAKLRPAFTLPSIESPHYFFGDGRLFVANWGASPRRIAQKSELVIDGLRFAELARKGARRAGASTSTTSEGTPSLEPRRRRRWYLFLIPLPLVLLALPILMFHRAPQPAAPEPRIDEAPPILDAGPVTIEEPPPMAPPPLPAPHQKIFFARGDHSLSHDQRESLEAIAAYLREHPAARRLIIQGHADDRGTEEDNVELSVARAERVRGWLIEQGIADERVLARGCGERHPVRTEATDEGRRTNRRVEFFVVEPPVPPEPYDDCR
jgi:outer membrane protein OmpA-like peptidoglycan-associated protein